MWLVGYVLRANLPRLTYQLLLSVDRADRLIPGLPSHVPRTPRVWPSSPCGVARAQRTPLAAPATLAWRRPASQVAANCQRLAGYDVSGADGRFGDSGSRVDNIVRPGIAGSNRVVTAPHRFTGGCEHALVAGVVADNLVRLDGDRSKFRSRPGATART
jgi:hypothetical protein